jgi:simple sugar transport system permease protein
VAREQSEVLSTDLQPEIGPAEPVRSAGPPPGGARRYIWRVFVSQREITPLIITIILFIYFSIDSSAFLTSLSLNAAAGYAGPVAAIAIGEVLVLMLGEIDLSAGQVFLFAPWVMYWLWQLGVPVGWGIVAAMIACAGVGLVNGLITTLLKVPSFVTTLATNFILLGLVLIFSNDTEASPIPGALPPQTTNVAPHVGLFGQVFGVWLWSEIIWVAGIALVVNFMLKRTRFGVRVIATGGNLMGAAEAGVPTRRVKVMCFVACSSISAFVGLIDGIKYGSLDPGNAGVDYILYAVGACVIGGTALTGGRGSVIGAFIGAILIGVLEAGLTIIGVSSNAFYVYIGLVIIAAMALNVWLDRLASRSRTS